MRLSPFSVFGVGVALSHSIHIIVREKRRQERRAFSSSSLSHSIRIIAREKRRKDAERKAKAQLNFCFGSAPSGAVTRSSLTTPASDMRPSANSASHGTHAAGSGYLMRAHTHTHTGTHTLFFTQSTKAATEPRYFFTDTCCFTAVACLPPQRAA